MFRAATNLVGAAPCKVLIIEDNVDGRESMRTLLSMLGCQVETAADGAEGVRKALALHPHIAFVDIGLPNMDGMEVAKQIRSTLGRRIFLVACTAYDKGYGGERTQEAQFDCWLVKPVALPDLLFWLRKAFAALN